MAELIAFRSPGRSYDARPAGAGAQILFFTGVRYERTSDEAPAARPKRRKPGARGGGGNRRVQTAEAPA